MKTAYSYIRWSTKGQGADDRNSKSRQLGEAQRWIRENGNGEYVLSDDVFIDAGKSGFKGKHLAVDEYGQAKGELKRFIQLVEHGKIRSGSILIVDDYSRFARLDTAASINLFTDVIMAGIGMVFCASHDKRVITRQLLKDEPHLLIGIVMEAIRSFRESEERSRKIKAAKQSLYANIKNGICQRNNLPPYFTFVPNTGSKSVGKYIHNDNTKIVKELAQLFLQGKSLYEIAGTMNGRKVKTFKGKDWSGNGVARILENPILKGEHKGVKNFAPAIIDNDEWQKIQNRLSQNVFHGPKGDTLNVFRGICFCADCGHTMSVMSNYNPRDRSQQYRYLRCSQAGIKNSSCNSKGVIRLNEMEQDFFFTYLMKNPAQLVNDGDTKEVRELDKQITTSEATLNELSKTFNDLMELAGTVKVETLKTKMVKVEKDMETVKGQLDTLNLQRSKIQGASHDYADIQKLLLDVKAKSKKAKWTTGTDEHGDYVTDNVDVTEMDNAARAVIKSLADPYVREGVRVMLPSLIGKITVQTWKGGSGSEKCAAKFFVYNRMGKLVYQSMEYDNRRNNSDTWKEKVQAGIKKYWANKRRQKKD